MNHFAEWAAVGRPAAPHRHGIFLVGVLAAGFAGTPARDLAAQGPPLFVRGDMNLDSQVSLADVSFYFDFRYLGGPVPGCLDAADSNDNGTIDSASPADGYFLLDWLFRTVRPLMLPQPFPLRGLDPTADGLDCDNPSGTEPGQPVPGYALTWQGPSTAIRGQKDLELFLLATTASEIECVSIAFRVDREFVENVRVDFSGTIFPVALRSTFESSPLFRRMVIASADPNFDLLLAGAVFLRGNSTGGFDRISFDATTGRLRGARLLRVLCDARKDAPLGMKASFFYPALADDQLPAGDFTHGVLNEFGGPAGGVGGGTILANAQPDDGTILYDGEEFLRGDANNDGDMNISDPQATLGFLFLGSKALVCPDAGDANDDGKLDISDATFSLNYLFLGGSAPPAPGPLDCGYDLKQDDLNVCLEGCE